MENKLIITAASKSYGKSLLALIGSIYANWPNHPDIRVYDLGMDQSELDWLTENNIPVIPVPEFCPHWRAHYTWKIWCWNDCPAEEFLWLDAGVCVLQPLDDIFTAIRQQDYFVLPTYHPLTENASEASCKGCKVDTTFREGKMTLVAGIFGSKKTGKMGALLEEALRVASTEEFIRATHPMHRHDQAILSLLLYKYYEYPIQADGWVYGGWRSPKQTPAQKIWVHRRTMMAEDVKTFTENIATKQLNGYFPQTPIKRKPSFRAKLKQFIRNIIKPPKKTTYIPDGVKD